jgi:hypothetical protein
MQWMHLEVEQGLSYWMMLIAVEMRRDCRIADLLQLGKTIVTTLKMLELYACLQLRPSYVMKNLTIELAYSNYSVVKVIQTQRQHACRDMGSVFHFKPE